MNVKSIHLVLIQNALSTDSNISFFKLPLKRYFRLESKLKENLIENLYQNIDDSFVIVI